MITKAPERIAFLKEKLLSYDLDHWLVTRGDAFQHELIGESEKRLEWLTHFSGSAGFAIISREHAGLFVDGRYKEQAHLQCRGINIDILDFSEKIITDFLAQKGKLGVDGRFITRKGGILSSSFLETKVDTLCVMDCLIEEIWQDRPAPLYKPSWNLEGMQNLQQIEERVTRIVALHSGTKNNGREGHLITSADTTCWLLGVRGGDLSQTPIVLSRALLVLEKDDWHIFWYVEGTLDRVENRPAWANKVSLKKDLSSMMDDLRTLDVLWLDPKLTNEQTYRMCESIETLTLHEATSSVRSTQTIKTVKEHNGFKECHIRDGAMMVKLLYWLDEETQPLDELTIIEKIDELRQRTDGYISKSFDSIVASGSNGSIIHYRAQKDSNREVKEGELLLIDCGGHYFDGTTDVTRTIGRGALSKNLSNIYTFVLKAHIKLIMQKFPEGTLGSELDAIARHVLWNEGLDYAHGTGHGVGHVLAVHESPPAISKYAKATQIREGMVLSIEPGYYCPKEFGCRIENLAIVNKIPQGSLQFQSYTCVPYDRSNIVASLLDRTEKKWLNRYHLWVEKNLSPLLASKEQKWLQNMTRPI